MSIFLLDSENADTDIETAEATVLTHTPDSNHPIMCQGLIKLGDGSKNLSATGGSFTFNVSVGGQTVQGASQVVTFGTEVRAAIYTKPFAVPPGDEVLLKVKSPNSADDDVDVTAYLYSISDVTPVVWGKVNDAGAAAADFDGDSGLSSTDNFYNGMFLVFASGALKGLARVVQGYTGSSKNLNFTGAEWPTAPANSDLFWIAGHQ